MDEKYHVDLADQINSEAGYPKEPYYRAPLYPYFLAFLFNVTDDSIYWSRIIQLIMGSFLPLLVYALSLKLFDRKTAIWAGFISAVYPTFIFFEASLLIEAIMGLLTVLLVWQLYRCERTLSLADFVIAGVLLGLAGLARPNILMFGPFLFVWIYFIIKPRLGWKKAIISYAAIGLTALVVILPVTIRNKVIGNDSVFIAWQGGFNFFLGNNHAASGWSATVGGMDESWEGGYKQSIAIAEKAEKRDLKFSEVSDFWYKAAWKEIGDFFGEFVALEIKKLRLLINGFEIPNNQSTYFAREYSWIMKPLLFHGLVFFPYGVLAPLSIIGIGFTLKNWRKYLLVYLVIISYALTLLMFFVCDRYRQPLIPFLIPFSVFAVYKIIQPFKKRDFKNISLVLFILVLLLIESNYMVAEINPRNLQAQDHFIVGSAEFEMGNMAGAEIEYKKAIALDPMFSGPYNNLGLIAIRRGDINAASMNFQKAMQVDPYNIEPYMNYSTFLIEKQYLNEALEILKRAANIQPLNDFLHLKMGLTLYQLDRKEEALNEIEESLRLNPNSESAKQALDQLNVELRK